MKTPIATLMAGALTICTFAATDVRYEPASPEAGSFPSDATLFPDPAQKTGGRVNLPLPDCRGEITTCDEVTGLNEFDGFSIFPRIRVRFTSRVDTETLRDGIFFVALDNLTREEFGLGPAGSLDRRDFVQRISSIRLSRCQGIRS